MTTMLVGLAWILLAAMPASAHAGAISISAGIYDYRMTDTDLAAQLTASRTKFFKDDALN